MFAHRVNVMRTCPRESSDPFIADGVLQTLGYTLLARAAWRGQLLRIGLSSLCGQWLHACGEPASVLSVCSIHSNCGAVSFLR